MFWAISKCARPCCLYPLSPDSAAVLKTLKGKLNRPPNALVEQCSRPACACHCLRYIRRKNRQKGQKKGPEGPFRFYLATRGLCQDIQRVTIFSFDGTILLRVDPQIQHTKCRTRPSPEGSPLPGFRDLRGVIVSGDRVNRHINLGSLSHKANGLKLFSTSVFSTLCSSVLSTLSPLSQSKTD